MKKKIIIYPFLIAFYPILFLYAYNIDEVFLKILVIPVIVSLIVSSFLFLFFKLITKDYIKSGLITTILLFGFYLFGSIQDVFSAHFLNNKILLLSFLALTFVYLLWRVLKFLLKEPSVVDTKKIICYIFTIVGFFLMNILTVYFISLGFSVIRLILLFSAVVLLFTGFYFLFHFKKGQISKPLFIFQSFLTVILLSVMLYVVVYQCGFSGITHRKLMCYYGPFLIFILVFIYFVKNNKVKKYTLVLFAVFLLLLIHYLIYNRISVLNFNLIPELAISIFLVSITFKIINSKNTFEKLNKVLNIALIILVSMPLLAILKYEIIHFNDKNNESNFIKFHNNKAISKKDLPPIYFIILDEYASSATIKELFNYNNSSFTEALEGKGFYVSDWQSPSDHTHEVVASVLNIGHHKRNASARENFRAIQNNLVTDYLKSYGYKIVQYPPWRYESYFLIQNADTLIKTKKIGIREKLEDFDSKILFSTILRRYISHNKNFYRTAVNSIFSSVSEIHKSYVNQPFFVYAHIISPHAPFVFDRDGNDVGVQYNGNKFYLGQYIYINNKVLELVEKLLQVHNGNCIIVVQSDHGPRESETGINTSFRQTHQIFNAIYFPDKNYLDIGEDVGININTFAILFNRIFNDSIKLYPVEKYR